MIFAPSHNRGFTLIEMIVSVGIFMIVAVVAVGALLKTVDANNKSQSMKTAITNLNFALESMTREIRVGTDYNCETGLFSSPTTLSSASPPCSAANGPWYIAFNSSKRATGAGGIPCSLIYAYRFDENGLARAKQTECGGSYTFSPLVSTDANQDVAITFDFGSIKVVTGENVQPYAQFRFAGSAGAAEKTKSVFDLQTTVSQRLRD